MASRLENRVAKLEGKVPDKPRLVMPHGWWYDEPNCEPYKTTEPVTYKSLDDWYAEGEHDGK